METQFAYIPNELSMLITLIWFFAGIVTILVLLMCFLFIAMKRALRQESESVAFAQMVIEGQEKERERISRELHDTILPLVKDEKVSAAIRLMCRKSESGHGLMVRIELPPPPRKNIK
jgi:signal transduction histidine kinase